MRISRLLGSLMFLGALAGPLQAQVVVGTAVPGSGNCYPFICLAGDNGYALQDLYSSSSFGSSLIDITALTFYDTQISNIGSTDGNTYSIDLSTVSFAEGALPTVANPNSNLGSNDTQVFDGKVMFPVSPGTSFTLTFATPFLYNPAAGNLLVDVDISGSNSIPNSGSNAYLDVDGSDMVQREYWITGQSFGVVDEAGLVTGFTTAAPGNSNVTPEPATMSLMATGLVALAGMGRRRRKA